MANLTRNHQLKGGQVVSSVENIYANGKDKCPIVRVVTVIYKML